jgi:hypothetical protein
VQRNYWQVIVAALLLAPLSIRMLWGHRVPSITSPFPLPLMFPVFLGVPPLVAAAIPSLVFCAWSWPLLFGLRISARRTLLAFVLVATASALEFGFNWGYGLRYQGHRYTLTTAIFSLLFAVVTAALLIRFWRDKTTWSSLAVNFILFAWVFTYAFPYLGELP